MRPRDVNLEGTGSACSMQLVSKNPRSQMPLYECCAHLCVSLLKFELPSDKLNCKSCEHDEYCLFKPDEASALRGVRREEVLF